MGDLNEAPEGGLADWPEWAVRQMGMLLLIVGKIVSREVWGIANTT
jgi:hypothetical protein